MKHHEFKMKLRIKAEETRLKLYELSEAFTSITCGKCGKCGKINEELKEKKYLIVKPAN